MSSHFHVTLYGDSMLGLDAKKPVMDRMLCADFLAFGVSSVSSGRRGEGTEKTEGHHRGLGPQ